MRLSLSFLIAALSADPSGGTVERRLVAMGTALEICVTARSRAEALDASEAAVREIARVEELLSTWKNEGPLARLNAAPEGVPVALPAELFGLLKTVFEWEERTEGAFDPTVLPLVRAWDLRGRGRVPAASDLRIALDATGRRRFRLDSLSSKAERLHPAAAIDEGAWGKGYALDQAAEVLQGLGVVSAVLDLGGQVLSLPSRSSEGVRVGLVHPRDRSRVIGLLFLRSGSLSTSGNSERSVAARGRRIGHLLDPRTGCPAKDFGSVTVLAPSGLVADILSTAFFVLGPENGARLSGHLRADGIAHEALFCLEGKKGLEARASAGLVPLIERLDIPLLPFEENAAPAGATAASGPNQEPGGHVP